MNHPAGPERRSFVLWSRNLPVALCLSLWTLASGCGGEPVAPPGAAADRSAPDEPWFTDRAKESGLDFMHVNGASGQLFIPEILAPGSALFDFDNDGDLDIFIPQGGLLGGRTGGAAPLQVPGSTPPQSRLYRNDLQIRPDGSRALSFTDVTQESHIQVPGYPMGAAAADVNNDGCVDLFVTGFGRNYLFRNGCDGSFTDIWKDRAPDWAVSASFLDYDRDGWLDLYVGNYVHYSLDTTTKCQALSGEPRLLHAAGIPAPSAPAVPEHRRRRVRRRDGARPVREHRGPALGVSTADFNQDGWIDIYVANDGAANMLWMNERDGTFRDTALLAGAALSAEGKPEGSMGVDAGDFDNDGDEDLFMTHLPDEGNNLYVNDGSGMFEDQSARSALGPLSLGYTGFGTAWFDYDNDGWLDILAVNGAVSLKAMRGSDRIPIQRAEPFVPQSGKRPLRGCDEPRRSGISAVRSEPRRVVRRHRQRRRHGRPGDEQQRAGAAAPQWHRSPPSLAWTSARGSRSRARHDRVTRCRDWRRRTDTVAARQVRRQLRLGQ